VRLSYVVPCYQEEDALPAFAAALPGLEADEVVFVDDGSTDGTARALAEVAARDDRVRVETHSRNRGVGAAMRTGFSAATGDVVVAYDADRTYPLEDARRLVAAVVSGADVATASPFAPGGEARATPFRRALSRAAAVAYRGALGDAALGISTFTCGFRAYRASSLRGLRFRSDGFPATAEILARLLLSGARVVEVGSRLTARTEGRSKMRPLRAAAGHLPVLVACLRARLAGGRTGLPAPAVTPS
jgi:dolichol-phosphate mannosyltransferase